VNILTLAAIDAAVFLGAICFHCVPLEFFAGLGFVVIFVLAVRESLQAAKKEGQLSKKAEEQLRTALIDTNKLAQSNLNGADDALKTKVAELLVEAGKHLNPPIADSRIYFDIYLVSWHHEGLTLIAQARQLIDAYSAAQQEREQEQPGN
jgi:hypothetical protein